MKRKFDGEENPSKRKKVKSKSVTKSDEMNKSVEAETLNIMKRKKVKKSKSVTKTDEKNKSVKAEALDIMTLREDMTLLGCVIEVRSNCFLMSLPGCLVGRVHITNISTEFTDSLRRCAAGGEEMEEPNLKNIVEVGALYPCKVLKIAFSDKFQKPNIALSINPGDTNMDLRLRSLYLKMVLYAAIQSVEDHGYVMDIGVKGAQGFMPFNEDKRLTVGQVVPTIVRKLPHPKSGNVVLLTRISHDESSPQVEDETLKLSSLLPGANVTACITNVKHPFLYMKCLNFDACANVITSGSSSYNLVEGTKVCGTVLYVHPISRLIYLFLGSKPSPSTFSQFFHAKKFDLIKNVKYEYSWHTKLFFKIRHGALGFLKKAKLPEKGPFSQESLLKSPVVEKARVVFLHYMDNLVQVSFKESLLDLEIKKPEEVKVLDLLEGVVKKHNESGMFIQICPGLFGFVRHIHMSDVFITMPEKLHPIDSKVKCRVLSKPQDKSGLDLTCKESLLSLDDSELLKSYEEAEKGQSYKGVIVQKSDVNILVLFFNGVRGIVSKKEIPEESLLYVGQTVSCEVLSGNPKKQTLKLSLMGGKKKKPIQVKTSTSSQVKDMAPMLSTVKSFEPSKICKAVITSITAHQLNIVVEGTYKGRIHISELGSPEENSTPLKKFSVGQALKVHCLGQYNRRAHTFLHITHQRIKHFLECSLEYPPPVALKRNLQPGMNVTGFIKEVNTDYVVIWLSPIQTGVLDYLHFSSIPKILRKVKKHLKVGLSINVTVLDVQPKRQDNFFDHIKLTKLEEKTVNPGRNVVGCVEVATLEKGVVLKLPHNYHGIVCLSDLHDVYAPVNSLLVKLQKLKYILCHVLEVDQKTKNCSLSLRKSRLYGVKVPENGYPEMSDQDITEGMHLKGFVKKHCRKSIIVILGRKLVGVVSIHKCSTLNCVLCDQTGNILKKYTVGNVVEVIVNGSKLKYGLYPLLLPDLPVMGNSVPSRLKVTEDIDWDDA